MSDVKRCVQCGLLKEEEAFRRYTYSKEKDTKGRYRVCKSCEAINSAYKRAKQWEAEHDKKYSDNLIAIEPVQEFSTHRKNVELIRRTEKLYELLESRGLRIPVYREEIKQEQPDNIDQLFTFYTEAATPSAPARQPIEQGAIPDELNHWLTMDSQEWRDNNISPEYLQETVYESLKAKYRPQIGIDKEKLIPIFDDTYKEILNSILHRFDDYEEEYIDG